MSQNFQLWPVYYNISTGTRANAAQISVIVQQNDGTALVTVSGGYDKVSLDNAFMITWRPAVSGWLVFINSQLVYYSNAAFNATFAQGPAAEIRVADIIDAGQTGKAVLLSATPTVALAAIGGAAQVSTPTIRGGVFLGAYSPETDVNTDVGTAVNSLLASLRTAGIVASTS